MGAANADLFLQVYSSRLISYSCLASHKQWVCQSIHTLKRRSIAKTILATLLLGITGGSVPSALL